MESGVGQESSSSLETKFCHRYFSVPFHDLVELHSYLSLNAKQAAR
jgi:hypothetical protein